MSFDIESSEEGNSAIAMAKAIGRMEGQLRGKVDKEEGLMIAFYMKAVPNQRMSKVGYHKAIGLDGKETLDEAGNLVMLPCDCDEIAVESKRAIPRVIQEKTKIGIHVTPGRPIFEDQVWIRIQAPGEKDYVDTQAIIIDDDHPAGDTLPEAAHNLKYPRHWEIFKKRLKGGDEVIIGTPLSELAKIGVDILKPSQVEDFRYAGVRTVEQLLAMSDVNGQKFMGWATTKRAVQAWSDAQAAKAPGELASALQRESDLKVQALQEQIAQQNAVIRQLQERATGVVVPADATFPAPEPKKRGRPKKTPEATP